MFSKLFFSVFTAVIAALFENASAASMTTVTRTTTVSAAARDTSMYTSTSTPTSSNMVVMTTLVTSTLVPTASISASSSVTSTSTSTSSSSSTAAAQTDIGTTTMTGINNTALGMTTNDSSLRTSMTWYWGANNNSVPYAKLSYSPATDDRRILDMDSMSAMINNVACANETVQIQFTNASTYQAASNSWQWMTQGNRNRSLAAIIHWDTCGATRLPYSIDSVSYDNATDTATLHGAREPDWLSACPGYNLKFDTQGVAGPVTAATLSRRITVDQDFTIDVSHDFSSSFFSEPVGGVDFSLDCADCTTFGSLDFAIDVVPFLIPLKLTGTASVTPAGLGASLGLGVTVSAGISAPISKTIALAPIALPGSINIPLVATIGPTLSIGVTAGLDSLDGALTVSVGAMANIADGAVASVDFEDSSKNVFTGLTPSFTPIGPTIEGSVTATGSIVPSIALGLDIQISAFNLGGASAGIALLAPELDLTLTAQASSNTGFCGDTTANAGVEFDAELVASFDVFAGLEPISALPNKIAILSTQTQLFSTCIAFTTPTATV